MNPTLRNWLVRSAWAAVLITIASAIASQYYTRSHNGYEGIASGNGRIEGVEVDIAARAPGRISEILVNEGDLVHAGQLVARMDRASLQAQIRQAEAQLQQAQNAVATAHSQVAQRESDKASAEAAVAQRQVDLNTARRQAARSGTLADKGFISRRAVEDDRARVESAEAALSAARAQVAAAEAAIANARSQILGAQSGVQAARANRARLQADIDDSDLKSPRDGRVQYRVAQAGEVVAAGGKVLNLVDLSDVHMTFFLSTAAAGRIALGAEVRLVLDAAREYVIPARVSYVSDVAQFTPKTVETASEREKLMFRIRAQIPPELLRKYIARVKTGLPGMAYVRLDEQKEWPPALQVKLPP